MHVLLVEDNPADVRLFNEALLLARQQHTLTSVSTAEAALDLLRQNAYDLIVFDLYLPAMTGADLLRTINAEALARGAHMVMLTDACTDALAPASDGAKYWMKPPTFDAYVARIHRILRRARFRHAVQ